METLRERQRRFPLAAGTVQHEAAVGLHRSAAQHGLARERESLRVEPELLEHIAEAHRQRAVDHDAERALSVRARR